MARRTVEIDLAGLPFERWFATLDAVRATGWTFDRESATGRFIFTRQLPDGQSVDDAVITLRSIVAEHCTIAGHSQSVVRVHD